MFRQAISKRCQSVASSKYTAAEKLFVKPHSNNYPGPGYIYNVTDPADDLPVDPITGEPIAAASNHSHHLASAVGGDTEIQRDVLALKRNPPVQFDVTPSRNYLGNPSQFAGGSAEPFYKHGIRQTSGYASPYLSLHNESLEGLVNAPMDSATSKDGVLHQPLSDSGKATQVLQMPFTEDKTDKGFKELPTVQGAALCDVRHPGRIEQEIQWHLSSAGLSLTHDGAFGSTTDDEVRVQIHTDSTAHALFWNIMLHNLPGRSRWEMLRFNPPVKIFHCPGFVFEPERVIEEYGGPKKADLGLTQDKFALIDPYAKPAAAIIAGDSSLDRGLDVGAYLTGIVMCEELDVLVVPGDAVINDAGEATVYITDSSAEGKAFADTIRKSESLFGAHHLTLSPDGLGRVWDGVTHTVSETDNVPQNSLVTTEGSARRVTKTLTRRIGDETSYRKSRNFHPGAPQRQATNYSSVDALEGMTLGARPAAKSVIRPNLVNTGKVKVVFVKKGAANASVTGDAAAKLFVEAVKEWGYPYASDEDLATPFAAALDAGLTVSTQGTTSSATSTPEPKAQAAKPSKGKAKKK
eukprot:TRINITY_DN12924_c0_g1_i2.p1 TRINITY_DN12924_c0_g1~~TRINITY_DN12924_c0_g1_i2.p1  ORF type:complete len:578 (+),score=228.26 TRINITY_DN12924_c0_g1_i2:58-1791(+)